MSKRIATVVGLAAILVVALAVYVGCEPVGDDSATKQLPAQATFVGRSECIECHTEAYELWRGSNHDNAMAEATNDTVLGSHAMALFA